MELDCYRFVGHGIGDDNTQGFKSYRTEEELESWKKRDPITNLFETLSSRGVITAEDAERIDEEVRREVHASIAFAESSPEPPLDSLYDNVYS